jgi:hypothetical protein
VTAGSLLEILRRVDANDLARSEPPRV